MTYKAAAGSGKYRPKATPSHKCRCETCMNRDTISIPTEEYTSEKWQYCKIAQSTLCNVETELIEKIGCASHSDFKYQCGDECKGECSGEVDGTVHCPYPKPNEAEKVLVQDALESVKELRSYPLNSHEEECLDIIEEALSLVSNKMGVGENGSGV